MYIYIVSTRYNFFESTVNLALGYTLYPRPCCPASSASSASSFVVVAKAVARSRPRCAGGQRCEGLARLSKRLSLKKPLALLQFLHTL